MSSKKNSFLKSLKNKSKRDVDIMLQSLQSKLSELTHQMETDQAKLSEVSSKFEDAKREFAKLEAELIAIQAKTRTNNDVQKTLSSQIDQTTKYLKTISKASEKADYVKRCIDYIAEYSDDDYIDQFDEYYGKSFLRSISTYQFIKNYLDNVPSDDEIKDCLNNKVPDDEIIEIAHLMHVIRLYEEFECENKHFEVDFEKNILFSELEGCSRDCDNSDEEDYFCCHKRFAYTIGSLDNIILYNAEYVNFNIDTTTNSVSYTRLN